MSGKGAIKEKVVEDLRRLSSKGRKEAEDFISYLRIKEELEATKEVLDDKELVKSIMMGDADFKAGRVKSWKAIKDDV
jgi:hypothetical protein